MPITFTDAEQSFADSPKGRMLVARAESRHNMREAHKGAGARPWTDAMEADAVRKLSAQEARSTVSQAATNAIAGAAAPTARAAMEAALLMENERVRNAWKSGR